MSHIKKASFIVIGLILLCASAYFFLGVLQAASLFTGERALWNANLWGSLSLVSLFCSLMAFYKLTDKSIKKNSSPLCARVIFSTALVLGALYILVPISKDYLAAAKCLDTGVSFNYIVSVCEEKLSNPYIPVYRRSGFRIVAASLLLILSVVAFRNGSYLWSKKNEL